MWWLRRNDQSQKWMQQRSTESVLDWAWLGRQGDSLGIEQIIEIWPYEQIVYTQPESTLGNEMHKLLWDFEIQTYDLISARWHDLRISNK